MSFDDKVSWYGMRLTLADLREFVERTKDAPGDRAVSVSVEPTYPNPTDPGGAIRLSASTR